MTHLSEYVISENPNGPAGAHQTLYRFPNGYGASVIRGGMAAYGGLELAVIEWNGDKRSITYATPITDDVVGYLNDESLAATLDLIHALPDRVTEVTA